VLTAYSRGTQLSVLGWHDLDLCVRCDADALMASTRSAAPVPADYRPAAMHGTAAAAESGTEA